MIGICNFVVLGIGSSSNSLSPHSQASQLLPTLVAECSVPTKHQNSSPLTHDLAREISQMVKDVYSEKEIAFAPIFNVKKTKANQFSSTTGIPDSAVSLGDN